MLYLDAERKEEIEQSFVVIEDILNEYYRGKLSMNRTIIELVAEIKSFAPPSNE